MRGQLHASQCSSRRRNTAPSTRMRLRSSANILRLQIADLIQIKLSPMYRGYRVTLKFSFVHDMIAQ